MCPLIVTSASKILTQKSQKYMPYMVVTFIIELSFSSDEQLIVMTLNGNQCGSKYENYNCLFALRRACSFVKNKSHHTCLVILLKQLVFIR